MCDYARIEGKNGFIRSDRDGTITVKPLFKPAFEYEYEIPKAGYRGDSCRVALHISSIVFFQTNGLNPKARTI